MIGIDIGTLHDHPTGLCSANPGIYVLADGGLAAGVVRNSECRLGAWGGWAVDYGPVTGPLPRGGQHQSQPKDLSLSQGFSA